MNIIGNKDGYKIIIIASTVQEGIKIQILYPFHNKAAKFNRTEKRDKLAIIFIAFIISHLVNASIVRQKPGSI